MSDFTGPGRNSEMSMIRSDHRVGWNFWRSSRWPGDSIWKHPIVSDDRMRSKVKGSSAGMASRSTFSPRVRAISSRAWRMAESIRTPNTSSLRSPSSSTSSLSAWTMR